MFSILFSSFAWADVCSQYSCPKGRKPIELCFNDYRTNTGALRRDAERTCGGSQNIKVVRTNADIAAVLQDTAKNCKSVDKMILNGHGNDGVQQTGELNTVTIQDFQKYGCLFNKNAVIEFYGCLVGKSCSGDLLLYQTAKSFLPNGGTVNAKTDDSISFLVGFLPSVSANFVDRTLTYDPKASVPDTWKMTGLTFKNGGDINQRCSSNLGELMTKFTQIKAASEAQCGKRFSYITPARLTELQSIKKKLDSGQRFMQSSGSEVFRQVYDAILSLRTDIRTYQSCWPQRSSSDAGVAL